MDTIKITAQTNEERECLNCKCTFLIEPYIEQDFCNRCLPIVCRAMFDKANGDLTCKQLVEKLRETVNGTKN